MATAKFNSKSPTIKRILREASELTSSPSADYHASPASDSDLFEWHFTLRGAPGTVFEGGIYHGRIILPPAYPLRPPSFRFLTPSGRFETNREICLSISGHHEETWQPAWGIRTALVALRTFMDTDAAGQLGGLNTGEQGRKLMAQNSPAWKCETCGKSNGEIMEQCVKAVAELGEEGRAEEEVPKDLVIGTKEDMENAKGDREAGKTAAPEGSAQIPVAQSPVVPTPISAEAGSSSAIPQARPAQSAPQPTGITSTTAQFTQPSPTVQHNAAMARERVSGEGVPVWVDRAIGGLIICLVIMIAKMILGI